MPFDDINFLKWQNDWSGILPKILQSQPGNPGAKKQESNRSFRPGLQSLENEVKEVIVPAS